MQNLLREMTIGVICSDSEGFSNTVMEYMAAGLPVIATDVGGNSELVRQGENGLLVPPNNPKALADAVIKLVKEPDISRSMGKSGKQFIRQEFSVDKLLQEMQKRYHSLLA